MNAGLGEGIGTLCAAVYMIECALGKESVNVKTTSFSFLSNNQLVVRIKLFMLMVEYITFYLIQ